MSSASHDCLLSTSTSTAERPQHRTEELANCLSHGAGFVLSAAAWGVWLQMPSQHGDRPLRAVAVSVFAASMMLLYLSSALCHGLPNGPAKRWLDRVDRAAIYLFIAGSYTPFAATALHGWKAWSVFGLIWAVALTGAALCLLQAKDRPLLGTGLYIGMGWLVLGAALPWIGAMNPLAVSLLLAGGATYTVGALLFLLSRRLRYAHLVWHVLVMTGSALHGAAVWLHV